MNSAKPVSEAIERFMSESPCIAKPEMEARAASNLMRELEIRHLPVVDDQGGLVGVVSERDLKQALAVSSDRTPICVEDVMSREPYSVRPDAPLSVVSQAMAERKIGCAVVLDAEGQVQGIFTATDAMRCLGRSRRGSVSARKASDLECL